MADITSVNQLALQSKGALEATGAFVVEPDGRVRMAPNRGGGYAPPWVWAPALTEDLKLRSSLATPSSDPSSPWRSAVPYSAGGPFTKHSAWDSQNGTYDGGIDWGTLLGTVGVGALFAAPALAAAFSSSGAAAEAGASASGAGPLAAGETGMAPTAAAAAPPASIAAMAAPAAAGGGSALATIANLLKIGAPIAGAVTNRLGQSSGAGNGVSSLDPALMSRLSTLLDMAQQRVSSAQPVHDAAMSMALRMAPTYAESPRLTQATQDATLPAPQGSYSPQTLAALRTLAGGR